jgi:hypothetical protein
LRPCAAHGCEAGGRDSLRADGTAHHRSTGPRPKCRKKRPVGSSERAPRLQGGSGIPPTTAPRHNLAAPGPGCSWSPDPPCIGGLSEAAVSRQAPDGQVVVWGPAPAHRIDQAMRLQQVAMQLGRVLASPRL